MRISELAQHLESIAPLGLAEDWDNVGLLVGDGNENVQRVMTCLTVTSNTVQEAIKKQADLIVSHHPFPFRATKRITTQDTVGRLLWQLIRNGISVYSPHTAWDSAADGINRQLAQAIGLENVQPLRPIPEAPDPLGAGRCGDLPVPQRLSDILQIVKKSLQINQVQYVGDSNAQIHRVAVACGSAGEFLPLARDHHCDLLLLGETSFHTCLEAEALGLALILPGHYASERFSLEVLAERLQDDLPDLEIWPSQLEQDPLHTA